ncbi:tetratricopeptide repeat protein [Parahaliea sp. F7430]|uniref:Tetratricopeptide repeat protein n=1 Tax=Sediminihaliea albiluteola TaxID=2758564 RepID=A0A7W2TU98_9GAMM|nr:FimV/HubP family polar landmark protein [Sediminihaliea albiluteola]MBA6412037.1 tetratricopeptide repeat protein [Sediminihaliea albiluteola]
MAQKRKLAAVMFSLGCLQASSVWALGLGELSLESFLNEPLKAKVDLLNTADLQADQIKVRLATAEDFNRLGVDRAYFLTGIKFEIQLDEQGRGYILLSSDDPVLEPYLDFILETRWPSGRLLREYTVLVDPPAFDQSTKVVSATERVAELEGSPAPAKKKTETQQSGTHLELQKQSDLASGAMPQRDYSAGTAAVPEPGARYMIRRDENLWSIARVAAPEGVSVHQTMLDIQRLNPDAFIDGNINQIKAGYIIYLPSAEEISSADLAQALSEIKQQNEDWRAGRSSASAKAVEKPALRVSAEPQEAQAEPEALESEQLNSSANAAALSGAMEALQRFEQQSKALQSRLDSLSEQVQSLQSIVSVKDDQIRALQEALRAQSPSGELPPGLGLNTEDVTSAAERSEAAQGFEAEDSLPADSDALLSAQQQSLGAASDQSIAAGQQDAQVQAEPGAAKELSAPNKASDSGSAAAKPASDSLPLAGSSWFSTWLYPAVALLLAALAGLWFWRRRQQQSDEDDSASNDIFAGIAAVSKNPSADDNEASNFAAQSDSAVLAADAAQPVSAAAEHQHGHLTDSHSDDALAEVDIFIAYRRYPQAIDLLKTAIASEPNNPLYRLRLLELYHQLGQPANAEEQLAALRGIGDQQVLARAEQVLASGAQGIASSDQFNRPTAGQPEGASEFGLGSRNSDISTGFAESDLASAEGFDELEIEDDFGIEPGEELDLSADFASFDEADLADDDEDLMFASEDSRISTKLDLARAYMDMGDEDGARQILDEVVLEGSQQQQQEAQALLDRL